MVAALNEAQRRAVEYRRTLVWSSETAWSKSMETGRPKCSSDCRPAPRRPCVGSGQAR